MLDLLTRFGRRRLLYRQPTGGLVRGGRTGAHGRARAEVDRSRPNFTWSNVSGRRRARRRHRGCLLDGLTGWGLAGSNQSKEPLTKRAMGEGEHHGARQAACCCVCMALFGTSAAHAQYTAKEWPEGPSKQRFVDTCDDCHDINRVRVGYTPEGWLTVVRMMQNMEAPVPANEWGAMTDYLMKNFPERRRPEAVLVDGPVKVDFKMWDVPTQGSRPHDPLAARDGSLWWSGQLVNKLGRVDPKTGAIREYYAQVGVQRPARAGRRQGRQHLVYGKSCRADRQARSQNRDRHRISAARSECERSAHAQFRSEGHSLVHGAASEHRRASRSRDRCDQARDLADTEVAPLRDHDQFEGRAGLRRVRQQQDRHHRPRYDGDQGIHAARRSGAAAASGDRAR